VEEARVGGLCGDGKEVIEIGPVVVGRPRGGDERA